MNLPKELYQEISKYLIGKDLINFLLVIRFKSDEYWKKRLIQDYPNTCVINYNNKQKYIRSYYLCNFAKAISFLSKCTLYKIVATGKKYRIIQRIRNKQIIAAIIDMNGNFIIRKGDKQIKYGTIITKYFGLEFTNKKGKLCGGMTELEIEKILDDI